MKGQNKEWHYIDEEARQTVGPLTLEELDAAYKAGKFDKYSEVFTNQMLRQRGSMATGITYAAISRLKVHFTPTAEAFYNIRKSKMTTVLSGPNNSGKTLLLKQLRLLAGHEGYLIACNRFSHIDVLNTRQIDTLEYQRYYENFSHNYYSANQNTEDNELRLEQVITGLKDKQRDKLFSACKELIGNEFSLQRIDPKNQFSPFYVGMDGENLRYGSSGTRLLLTMLGILLDDRFSTLLIDEPEIGLSPRIQTVLAKFLYEPKLRRKFCPHLLQIYVATHSHLFLDKNVLANNHIVTKAGDAVTIKAVESIADYHQLQFNMLGNELEAISLPSAIVLVEGESDTTFLNKVVRLHLPNRKVSIVGVRGEGEMLEKLNFFKQAFGDIMSSPYRDRLFVLLDKRISVRLPRIERQGVPKDNIILLSKNGIEYFYPHELVAATFHCSSQDIEKIKFEDDPIEYNGIRKTKKELAQGVADALAKKHKLHSEIKGLVSQILKACN